jgi:hypothetical protein
MRSDIATPELLAQVPELAAVEVLDNVADTALRSLIAAHPELDDPDFLLEHASVTPELCLASAVLSAIRVLADALGNYRVYSERRTWLRSTSNDIPF